MILLLINSLLFLIWDCHATITPKQVTLPDSGITLEYAVHGKKNHSPPIIAIHGFSGSWSGYYLLMESMPDYQIYAVTLPCWGGSTKDDVLLGNFDNTAEIIIEFMDHFDIDSAYLIGHSMGSLLVVRIALLYPNRIDGVITVGTVGSLSLNPELLGLFQSIEDTGRNTFNLSPEDFYPEEYLRPLFESVTLMDLIPDWFFDMMIEDALKAPFKCYIAGINVMRELNQIDQLHSLELPFLIIHGAGDFVTWDAMKGGAESVLLNVPDVILYKFHNLAHSPHQEDPEKIASVIRTFIKSIPK